MHQQQQQQQQQRRQQRTALCSSSHSCGPPPRPPTQHLQVSVHLSRHAPPVAPHTPPLQQQGTISGATGVGWCIEAAPSSGASAARHARGHGAAPWSAYTLMQHRRPPPHTCEPTSSSSSTDPTRCMGSSAKGAMSTRGVWGHSGQASGRRRCCTITAPPHENRSLAGLPRPALCSRCPSAVRPAAARQPCSRLTALPSPAQPPNLAPHRLPAPPHGLAAACQCWKPAPVYRRHHRPRSVANKVNKVNREETVQKVKLKKHQQGVDQTMEVQSANGQAAARAPCAACSPGCRPSRPSCVPTPCNTCPPTSPPPPLSGCCVAARSRAAAGWRGGGRQRRHLAAPPVQASGPLVPPPPPPAGRGALVHWLLQHL